MKHNWDYAPKLEDRFFGLGAYGVRQCRNCKVIQRKESQTAWMRVTGYRWEPLVGRCKGKQVQRSTKGRTP